MDEETERKREVYRQQEKGEALLERANKKTKRMGEKERKGESPPIESTTKDCACLPANEARNATR